MAVNRDKVIASAEKLVAKAKIEPAIKEYERLLDDNPNDVNTLNRIGDLWVRINRNDEAVRVFSKIADHYSRDGFFLKAIAIYKKINKLDPSKLDVYAKLADLYAKQGLAMEAKSQYQILADYHLKHGDPTNALLTYKKISELDPNSINVHVKLADLYSQNNRTGEALKEYDRVGKMLLKRGMLDEALQVFRKALKIDAGNLDLVDSLVAALLEAKDYENSGQILRDALDSNPSNPRLTALLGRTYLAKGDLAMARTILSEGLTSNPNDMSIREMLSDVYLRRGEADYALDLLAPVIDNALARSEGRNAVDMLNRILRTDSSHSPTLEKLVAVYTKLREETNVLSAMNSLAEAHVARQDFAAATNVLGELIRREPDNLQHREKLAFVQMQRGGGVAQPPAQPRPAPRPPAEPTPQPAPASPVSDPDFEDLQSSGPELAFDLDSSEPVEVGLPPALELEPMEFIEEPPPREAEPPQPVADDLDFITEHLTEADVFAKYGLADKAIEHLRAVLERLPGHLGAYEKLLRVQLDEGDAPSVTETARAYIEALNAIGDLSTAAAVERVVLARGFSVESSAPSRPEPTLADMARHAPAPSLFPPQAAPEEEISFDLEGQGIETEVETGVETEVETEVEFDLDSMPLEMPAAEPAAEPEPSFDAITFEEPPAFEYPAEMDDVAASSPAATVEETEPFFGTEAEHFGSSLEEEELPEAPVSNDPAMEELGEIDFYLEQELLDDARSKLEALTFRYPDHPQIGIRQARLEAMTPPPVAASPEPESARSFGLSAADIENELLSAIPDEDEEFVPSPARTSSQPTSSGSVAKPVVDEGSLFEDEEDFFDLAAELEEELEEEMDEVVSLSEEEQTLEQIFKEFKKGVEQQLDSEDYDTHYNLGIAYKEMGLIDEAIGEFQLASKDQKRLIECCSMLGLCFIEKGMPQLAIKWYLKGLDAPEISNDEHLGLLYDLGTTYLEIGDTENAHKSFLEVYGTNTNYRDVADQIKQLEDVQR